MADTDRASPEAASTADRKELLFDPRDRAFLTSPFSTYKRMLEESPRYKSPYGGWILSRHRDCQIVLEHPAASHDPTNAETRAFTPTKRYRAQGQRSFLSMDPPDHTRLRGLVSKAFTPRMIDRLRPLMQQIVDEAIDRYSGPGEMEIIDDLAYPLPIRIICEMLGVPSEDEQDFKNWSRLLTRGLDPEVSVPPEEMERRMQAGIELTTYLRDLIEERRKNPKEDLISELIAVEEQGDKLSRDELMATLRLLLIAGHETTVNLIGNGVLQLLRHRSEFERLGRDPSLAKTAVEEVLRFDPPVLFTGRTAMEDIELDGITIRKGEHATVLIGAANRDPEVFDEPERFDIGRRRNPHLAFGLGIHFCLGAPLARVEGQIALTTLANRLPKMKLQTDAPEYREHVVLRGLRALHVSF